MNEDKINSKLVVKSLLIIAAISLLSGLVLVPFVYFDLDTLKEFVDTTKTILLSSLLLIAVIDNIFIFFIMRHKPIFENMYIDFHRRHGFIKITLLKILGVIVVFYGIYAPMGSGGKWVAPVPAYGFFVFIALYDYIKKLPR